MSEVIGQHPWEVVNTMYDAIVERVQGHIERMCDQRGIPKAGHDISRDQREKCIAWLIDEFGDGHDADDDVDGLATPIDDHLSAFTIAHFICFWWLCDLAAEGGDEFPSDVEGLLPTDVVFDRFFESSKVSISADDTRLALGRAIEEETSPTLIELIRYLFVAAADVASRPVN